MRQSPKKILVTGSAGFIGMHVAMALSDQGHKVFGVDNINDYYDTKLKIDRLSLQSDKIEFKKMDLCDREELRRLFKAEKFDIVINLAAQAGVRYSLKHPEVYLDSNIVGFGNILEACREASVEYLVYASSSSVYGRNTKIPFSETDPVVLPANLYASTKRSNELMAESYNHLFGLKCTGLRFFTVYGPWGRPDMAYYKFTKLLFNGDPLPVFNMGRHHRDMTYIDDMVDGIISATQIDGGEHRIFNLGNNKPIGLMEMIEALEDITNCTAKTNMLPMQKGDVLETYADITAASKYLGFAPSTALQEGLQAFVDWYVQYHQS